MTRPDPRKTAALSAALSGAVDLGALRARADAARTAAATPAPAGGAPAPDNGSAPWIVDVTEASFQAVVEQSLQVPVVVLLGASYSPESQQLAASLTRFATASGGAWILARVDLEASPRIGQAFGVQSVPTTIAVAAGQPIDAFAGPIADAELSQWIARLLDALRERLPGIRAGEARAGSVPVVEEEVVEDPRIVAAEEAFERGDYVAAQGFYSEILASEPGNELAKEGLAQARFAERAEAVDPAVIAKADSAPEDIDAQLAAADAQVAGQMVDEAFSRLVETVRRVFGEDRDRVRQHLVGLFELFPADDPRVAAARRKLASALY
ncbi:tetratricopeptide repeat protein [Lentzea flaviverrucosa]|uniref:Putative thioredoxin n=1 Tax=Lentzea flaviverrucosa TaxID=200379 RepID=A0A1H9RF67_9PSEU|nr:tetratricopeptide repeat protein [Lentzea flaviverrucosa]RDI32986.1 putative thioredoxin [Lentzea flaviverrucosa]SER71440.1 putative thioredoxin [Lentzea flaviverrucosa]